MCWWSPAHVLQTTHLATEMFWLLLSHHQPSLSLLSHLQLDQTEDKEGMKMIWVTPSAEAFFWAMLGHRILSCPWRNRNWTERLKCKSVMLQNCRRTKTRSWRPVRKANKTKSCSGESEILSHHCLQTITLDNQSDAEKFSVLSGEFYNLSAQLTDFDSFLATLWHRLSFSLYPLSFLSSPFLVLATLHRDLYKMTENHLLHSFSSSSSCQIFSIGWSWCPGGVWMMYRNRRGVKLSYCPSVSLQGEKPGTVGDNPSHLPDLGFYLCSFLLHSFGALERVSPFLSSLLFSRLRLGVLLVWRTDFEWVTHC